MAANTNILTPVWRDPLEEICNNSLIENGSITFRPDGSAECNLMAENSNNTMQQIIGPDGSVKTTIGVPEGKISGTNEVNPYTSRVCERDTFYNCGTGDRTANLLRDQIYRDKASAVGGTSSEVSSKKITLAKNRVDSDIGSDASNYGCVTGDKNEYCEKNSHIAIEGNCVKSVGGTECIMNKGQFTRDVQGGNWEVRVNTGEGKIYAATKLTFQVGTSTIVMEPNKITITADRIDLNP